MFDAIWAVLGAPFEQPTADENPGVSHVITVLTVSINKYNKLEQPGLVSSLKSYPLLETAIDGAYSSLAVIMCWLLQKATCNPK